MVSRASAFVAKLRHQMHLPSCHRIDCHHVSTTGAVLAAPLQLRDGRLYRNVTIGEIEECQAVKVTDYWGEPTTTPNGAGR
jgi:hypothetical protein